MPYVSIRKTALAVATLSAALSLAACQGSDTASGTSSPSTAPAGKAPSSAPASAPSSASSPSAAPSSGASKPTATASPVSGTTGTKVRTCTASALKATAHQAADRPAGTGTGAAIVEFTNTSARPCLLQGHPTVAGAANGSPEHNAPLKVTPVGPAPVIRLAPGGTARVKLTFVQVQGEGDGYCKSGAQPVTYPTLVVGLPGAGAHQVALDDGVFAECDNTVTATAVSAAALS
ncbi:DUF4232 domain-containing protein [Streptomyces gilvus]|uniref:DUF4232 domain-containing protein n=1 Tax=Streptomyces gilvus TaxID=2920937 RepID=UPI001F116E8F|nr:DUF4232 domain-containing protein [Streptomyces sp. CME 23]MCH5676173.1 DUF4232 domain-containing protein [Streptomyces sp. CME 23]